MTQLISHTHREPISYSFNEKQQLQEQALHDLPPTPSSSALSFLVTDQRSIEEEDDQTTAYRLPVNNTINTAPLHTANYGSLSSPDYTYFKTTSPTASSPAASTISPNDDDEGLYLLWTHQLLRERGYKPSSCKATEDDDDYESVDSSITDLSVDPEEQIISASSLRHHPNNRQAPSSSQKGSSSSYISSWLASCFPMC